MNSIDLSQHNPSWQEISEIFMGNDCIVIWLGNDKDESFYGKAK